MKYVNHEDTMTQRKTRRKNHNDFFFVSSFVPLCLRGSCAALLFICSCGRNDSASFAGDPTTSAADKLPLYVCHRVTKTFNIDGKMDDTDWGRVPWTHELVNIEGADREAP